MNEEKNRVKTFDSWPASAPIEPYRIATAGFYYTQIGLEVQCYWCKCKISEWHYGDQVMAKHRRLNSRCPFVLNPSTSGNVPITNQPTISEVVPVDLMNEQCRLSTFKNWPVSFISPQSLAKTGFYYFNKSDQVKCAWCQGVVGKWEVGDNPFTEHQRFFPNCPRVALGPNIEVASNGIRDLGIQQVTIPKKEIYSTLDARIRSFTNWPCGDIQHPEILATAGFYYQNIDDQVRCFHCNGGLRSWQKEDDPWYEHAKWFPECDFVQLVKGSEYINSVQGCRSSLDDAMNIEPVKTALAMGLNEGRIRAAVKFKLDTTGRLFLSTESLISAVFDAQTEENNNGTDYNDTDHDSSRNLNNNAVGIIRNNAGNINCRTYSTPRPTSSSNNGILQQQQREERQRHQSDQRTNTINPLENITKDLNSKVSSTILKNIVPGIKLNSMLNNTNDIVNSTNNNNTNDIVNSTNNNNNDNDDVNNAHVALEEENRKLKDARTCKICMDEEVGVVFLPCGHLVTCVQCAIGITLCPLCRSNIKGFVRTFLS